MEKNNSFSTNPVTQLLGIEYPIVQGGMIWCSEWPLAAAVSNAGGLGVIGAGSLYPEQLKSQIEQCQAHTDQPFGVNIPLLYPNIEEHIATVIACKVPVVITSAGNPMLWTAHLKAHGIKVIHVIANSKFALKCEQAGVDALVCEGFEAGGHNGKEETTTFCLIPEIRKRTSLPLIAAGGIASGQAFLAALVLGADGIQMGSRFVASVESSAHPNFKAKVIEAQEGDTQLMLKKVTPVRLLKNPFYEAVAQAEHQGASVEELKSLLGRGRSKKGMYEGDLVEGELEIGQVASQLKSIEPVATIMNTILTDFYKAVEQIKLRGW